MMQNWILKFRQGFKISPAIFYAGVVEVSLRLRHFSCSILLCWKFKPSQRIMFILKGGVVNDRLPSYWHGKRPGNHPQG